MKTITIDNKICLLIPEIVSFEIFKESTGFISANKVEKINYKICLALKCGMATELITESKEEAQSIFDQIRKAMEDYHNEI